MHLLGQQPRRVAAVSSAVAVGVIGAFVINTLPVFLVVLARAHGLDEADTGFVALADMGGIAVGTVLCAAWPRTVERMGWRSIAAIGLVVLAGANLLTVVASQFSMLLLARSIAGLGAGITMAVTYAVLAEGDGARDLAVFNVAQQMLGWYAMSRLSGLADRFGPSMLFVLIAACAAVAIPACLFLPANATRAAAEAGAVPSRQGITVPGWAAIGSVLVNFMGIGAVYTYLEFMGVSWGGRPA